MSDIDLMEHTLHNALYNKFACAAAELYNKIMLSQVAWPPTTKSSVTCSS